MLGRWASHYFYITNHIRLEFDEIGNSIFVDAKIFQHFWLWSLNERPNILSPVCELIGLCPRSLDYVIQLLYEMGQYFLDRQQINCCTFGHENIFFEVNAIKKYWFIPGVSEVASFIFDLKEFSRNKLFTYYFDLASPILRSPILRSPRTFPTRTPPRTFPRTRTRPRPFPPNICNSYVMFICILIVI